jgi:2-methylcitrate dehydratase PrpD
MNTHDLRADQISGIDVHLFKRALMLTNEIFPETIEGAQYSVQYSMAVAAVEGKEALCPMDPRIIGKKKIAAFAKKIKLFEDEELTRLFPVFAPARVVIHSRKGDFEKYIKSPLGDPANPMDMNMIENKINQIADQNSFTHIASRVVDGVKQLEYCDARRLSDILGNKLG